MNITLHTIFEDKEILAIFAKIFNVLITDFETEDGKNYLNEKFPKELDKQVQSLFNLRIIKGWTFCNFWDHSVGQLEKIHLDHLNLDGFNFIEKDLNHADFSHSSLVRTYFRGADLEHANFQYSNLGNAYLMNANLQYSQLQHANLIKAQINGIQLNNANIKGVIIEEERMELLEELTAMN
jgi:uncharacterized protein YjbI with pentapeptide repeats